MFDDMSDDEMIGWLEDQGALILEGVDENGEFILRMNADKMKEVFPEFYEAMMDDLSDTLMELYELGYVDISYNEHLEAGFSISEEGRRIMKKHGYDNFKGDLNND